MIYIKRGNNKISFEGRSTYLPIKFMHQNRQYLTGKTYSSFRAKVNLLDVEIFKLTQEEYNMLEYMIFDTSISTGFEIKTEIGQEFYMVMVDDRLTLTFTDDDEYNRIYSGRLQFTE